MMDQNTCFAYLNMELPDDIRRLKEAGYYDAAIARIDACLAEDWTASQNQPLHPQGALPVNPTPHGVDAWRQGLLAHREILRRLPRDYTLTADQLLNRLQATLRDFTAEEFAALDAAGQMDWRFVEGQKRYIYRAAGGDGTADAFRNCRIGQDRQNHAAQALHRGYAASCNGKRGQGGYAR